MQYNWLASFLQVVKIWRILKAALLSCPLGMINYFSMILNHMLLLTPLIFASLPHSRNKRKRLPSAMVVNTCRSFWLVCWCAWDMVDFSECFNVFVIQKHKIGNYKLTFYSLRSCIVLSKSDISRCSHPQRYLENQD